MSENRKTVFVVGLGPGGGPCSQKLKQTQKLNTTD